MRIRWPFVVGLIFAFVVLVFSLAYRAVQAMREALPLRPIEALQAAAVPQPTVVRRGVRAARIEVAPPPAPSGSALPLRGDPSQHDRYGTPLQTADRDALVGLLYRERYAELTAHFEEYERRFEANPRLESEMYTAFQTFEGPRSWLPARLDAWVRATPNSFAPHLARGYSKRGRGLSIRGGGYASEVEPAEFAAMHALFTEAREDFSHALALRPQLLAPHTALMSMARNQSDHEAVIAHYEAALRACPSCLAPRLQREMSLETIWGGAPGAALAYAHEQIAQWRDPRAEILRAQVRMDECQDLARTDPNRALPMCAQVIASVDDAGLLARFGWMLARYRSDDAAALVTVQRALMLEPYNSEALKFQVDFLLALDRYEDAVRAAHAEFAAGPVYQPNRETIEQAAQSLANQSRDPNLPRAARVVAHERIALARQVLPLDQSVQYADLVVVGFTGPPRPGQQVDPALVAAAAAAPDDLFTQREADLSYSLAGDYAAAASLWERFLARHPESGRAHLEYAGALTHLGRAQEAQRQLALGCDTGELECCLRLWESN